VPTSPWEFGTNQLLTVLGLLLTLGIAIGGFRTFERWKREKIEETRIGVAIDTLALMYESKFVFENIRSEMVFDYEWQDMSGDYRSASGKFYAVLKRVQANKDFFERAWKTQVRCTAVFGPKVEGIFLLMHRARREIEVSAEMLMRDPQPTVGAEDNVETWKGFRADLFPAYGAEARQGDKVGKKLSEFRQGIENLCRPIVDREFGRRPGFLRRIASAWSKKTTAT
jgi:hypothetical protein